jgi:U32 family peptidase
MKSATPELLVPAGDMEKLQTALYFGADAVYLGGEVFGLRSQAGNFPLADLGTAVDLCHAAGCRLYLTLNAFLRPEDQASLTAYLEALRPLAIDAYIVADPGVLALVRQLDPQRSLHLSTQANTTNACAINFWADQGIERVNLARELSLEEIRLIRCDTDLDLEVFVHGAMCMAYSGRCLLSAGMAGRSANQGNCAHPCRWSYALVEAQRPGEYYPIEQDERGSYIMNSRDLCLVEHLPGLLEAGVNSLKIEGRMKGCYYVATVTRVYRQALDRYLADPAGFSVDPCWLTELDKVSHRPYASGFLFADGDPKIHARDTIYQRTSDFVGVVLEKSGRLGLIEGRNRFFPGEQLEVFGPQMRQEALVVGKLTDPQGVELPVMQPNGRGWLELPEWTRPGDMLRRSLA